MVVPSGEPGDILVLNGTVLMSIPWPFNLIWILYSSCSGFLPFLKYYYNPNIDCDSFCCSVQSALFQVVEFWCPGLNNFCMYTIISVHVSKSSFSAVFHRLVSLNIQTLTAAYHWEFDLEKVSSAAFQIILVVLITGFFLQQMILTQILHSLVLKLCLVSYLFSCDCVVFVFMMALLNRENCE